MTFEEIVPGATLHTKSKLKKTSETKMNIIDFDNLHIFVIHGVADKYDVSLICGPDFKLWYTGAGGRKSGAPTISTDEDYVVLAGALHKKPMHTNIGISFDLNAIAAFKIHAKRALALEEEDLIGPGGELSEGYKIPQLDMYTSTQQLHGVHVQHIKNEWQCQQHLGENGWPGACYIKPGNSAHIGLNIHHLASWAAAMAAREATKYQPPNILDFDGMHNGTNSFSRAQGRTGLLLQAASMNTSTSLSAAEQPMSMISAFFTTQAKMATSPPTGLLLPPPQASCQHTSLLTFPLPTPAVELQRCLEDFCQLKGIDIIGCHATLEASALSPDIFPHLTVARITELTSLVEGHGIKLQVFGKQWSTSLEEAHLADGPF